MRVLLTGATGLIGGALTRALLDAGHEVRALVRTPSRLAPRAGLELRPLDVAHALDSADWLPHLAGVDAVVNAVGVFQQTPDQRFEVIHRQAPQALFAACVQAGVRRVVQVSALGAGDAPRTAFLASKRAADDFLLALPLQAVVLRPSLVFDAQGPSARLFVLLASLPLWLLPGPGAGPRVQPVHLDDLVAVLVRLLAQPAGADLPRVLDAVGPEPLALREHLLALRAGLGLHRPPWVLRLPPGLVRALARLAGTAGSRWVTADSVDMLLRGNQADAAPFQAWLGRPARPPRAFIEAGQAPGLRLQAQLAWLLPVLRASLAAVWIWTALVSLGLYPREHSLALLARVGATGWVAGLLLGGAAVLDGALGLATLWLSPRWRPWLWQAQAALVLGYTALITWRLPEQWLHPFGPVLKNLPILAILLLLLQLEPPPPGRAASS